MYADMILILLGFITGNFLYQAMFQDPDWFVALERSYFQAAIVIGIILWFAIVK
jgi:uncharacterized membrane-anchored protein YjiN (DUF445 family)